MIRIGKTLTVSYNGINFCRVFWISISDYSSICSNMIRENFIFTSKFWWNQKYSLYSIIEFLFLKSLKLAYKKSQTKFPKIRTYGTQGILSGLYQNAFKKSDGLIWFMYILKMIPYEFISILINWSPDWIHF